MTKQEITPITSQASNPFFGKSLKRRIGSPLYTTYKHSVSELEERDRRCREEPSSKESRIFGDVFYLNMMRKELANEKITQCAVHYQSEQVLPSRHKEACKGNTNQDCTMGQ